MSHKTETPLAITEVRIRRAEGPHELCDREFRVFIGRTAEDDGNAYLREIARTAPKDGSYDKTDVKLLFENGQEWDARFDIKHPSQPDNDTDLRKHVYDFLFFHLNPEQIPWIRALDEREQSQHIHSIRGMWTQEERADAATFLAQINPKQEASR